MSDRFSSRAPNYPYRTPPPLPALRNQQGLSRGLMTLLVIICLLGGFVLVLNAYFRWTNTRLTSVYHRWSFVTVLTPPSTGNNIDREEEQDVVVIDEETLKSMPRTLYKLEKTEKYSCSCSICLCDYLENVDVVKVLKVCGHVFHSDCVDPWLRSHGTCPVCRVSALATTRL